MAERTRTDFPAADGRAPAPAQPPADPRALADAHLAIPPLPRITGGAIAAITAALVVLLIGLFLLGWIPHSRRLAAARAEARERVDTRPSVQVALPKPSTQDDEIVLPADIRANQSTAIFARTNGYLKPLPPGIDIGARVQSGQLLAEIATPEVDAQLEQARATLVQTRATVARMQQEHELSVSTLSRYESATDGAVAQQQLDEQRSQEKTTAAALDEARANVAVAEASVKRLLELQAFQTVVAPFDGVLTARGFDAGALVSSGAPSDTAPLFRIDDTHLLRVEVDVPQGYATDVREGQKVDLLVRNYPGEKFEGVVARTSGAIDAATRTLLAQVDVPNADGRLLPGMYGRVRILRHRDRPPLVAPASALIMDAQGVRVATVQNDRVRYRTITLGRDFGAEVEVVEGLAATDQVILNPGPIADGVEVTVVKP